MSKKYNENNKIDLCKKIQNDISLLSQNELNEIFKILYNNDSKYTQNNNGIFVNLNWLEYDIILQINNYIDFCIKSYKEIKKHEIMKNMFNENLNKKKIEIQDIVCENESKEIINENNAKNQKISSSMKFYLFKKKFQKKNITCINYTNVLFHENYLFKKNDI